MTFHYRFWKSEGEYRYCRPGHDLYLAFSGTLYPEYVGQVGEVQQYISTTTEFAELAFESWECSHQIKAGDVIIINGSKAKVFSTYNSADGAIEVITNLRTSVVETERSSDSKVKALLAVERQKQAEQEKREKKANPLFGAGSTDLIIPIVPPKKKRWWQR